jgi:ribosomal protein S18 acetylase RimI-like enzyme
MIVGFAAGNIRILPNYLGNKKVGYISHVYVSDEFKKQNIGKKLVLELENWFDEKAVAYIELEVLIDNEAAHKFWEKLGFITDNIRKIKKYEKF